MFTQAHQVLMNVWKQDAPAETIRQYPYQAERPQEYKNYYIYHYCPSKGLIYALIDRLDASPIDEVLLYLEDLKGPFLYFNQDPYARMDYHAKQQEMTKSYNNKHTIIF